MRAKARWRLAAMAAMAAMAASSATAADLTVPAPTVFDFEGRAMIRAPASPGRGCPVPPGREGAPVTITNAPCDPTYVGSSYGLGRPSRDGLVPGPGFDDPYDRPLARRR